MKAYKTLENGVNILEYNHDMAQAVADMWNNSGEGWGGDSSVRTASDIISELNSGSYENIYVAEKDGEILGFASLSKYFADGEALYIHVLNVRPAYHGYKLGKALVKECVERTIELGYPRLDIHTWPGNTKAVPLYKKCGYMWEDRVDATHLVNFVPTILKTEACGDFWQTADWYNDNTRSIEIEPDGVKENKFEVFHYSWEKEGRILKAGFERTGRRMRMLETNDFKVELCAQNHELAFGLKYTCQFVVTNKNGKPLNISIKGKDDGNIKFDYTAQAVVEDTQVFNADFFVGEVAEPQNIWRVHPCVSADIYIDGLHALFGMGINTKWPISLRTHELKKIVEPGGSYDCYFSLESAVLCDAKVKINMPGTPPKVTAFDFTQKILDIPKEGKTSFKSRALSIGIGYEALPIEYEIETSDGQKINYTRIFHVISRGLSGMYSHENENAYVMHNGPWEMGLDKNGSYTWTNHVSGKIRGPGFPIGQLGKPYSDEFTRKKPINVVMKPIGDIMAMEATFVSDTYKGVEYTVIYTMSASGEFTVRHKVVNNSGANISFSLKNESHPRLGDCAVLPYDGGVQSIRDTLSGGAYTVDIDKIDENWVYNNEPNNASGMCWPKEYKLNVRWGDCLYFEHEFTLSPGAVYENKAVKHICGNFCHYADFRDFAMQTFTTMPTDATPHIDWALNGFNPFADTPTWTGEFFHYRNIKLEGAISIQSKGGYFNQDGGTYSYESKPGDQGMLHPVTLHMDLNTFEKKWKKVLIPANNKADVKICEQDGVHTATNGLLAFKADPRFSNVCFSLNYGGREWLMTKYPILEPFAWYNPFAGGIYGSVGDLAQRMIIKENIMAEAASEKDSFGNIWTGIKTFFTVEKADDYKGLTLTHYFLTLPGTPVMVHFMRLLNKTGTYRVDKMNHGVFLDNNSGDFSKLTLFGTNPYGIGYRVHAGCDDWEFESKKMVGAEIVGQDCDKLYIYRNTAGQQLFTPWVDKHICSVGSEFNVYTADGETHTSKPAFYIFTKEELIEDMLIDLDKLMF